MYIDKENLLCDDMAITDTDKATTNIIDLGADGSATPTPNEKGDVEILCIVTEAFTGGTSLSIAAQTDSAEGFGTVETIATTAAIATASLVLGYQFKIAVPADALKRYFRLYCDVTGTMTAGKITAAIVKDRQTNR